MPHGDDHRTRRSAPTVTVGASPFGIVIDHHTGSVFVADGAGAAVFDGRMCNAHVSAGCAGTPIAIPAGHDSIGIAIEDATDTVYVTNAVDDKVSVIDGATCNAHVTSRCRARHPSVHVGSLPSHLAIDDASHTLYVTNEGANAPGHTLSMIDTSLCNATVDRGCRQRPATATVGAGPDGLSIDARTHTLYVTNGVDRTVSILDTATCNSRTQTGCGVDTRTVRLASGAVGSALDVATHTLFVPTYSVLQVPDAPGSVSIIDTATCNAIARAGCNQVPARVTIGSGPIDMAVDMRTRRAYAVNQEDSDVSVVDIRRCNATRVDGCRASSPTMAIGFDGGALAVDANSGTVYASSQHEGTVTVLDAATCTGSRGSGCRHPAPVTGTGLGPAGSGLSHSTGTLYVANQFDNSVSVIDTTSCNQRRRSGCRRTWPTITVGQVPMTVAVDDRLDTLYVPNLVDSTVSVIDARTCNAHTIIGCDQTPHTIAVSGGAYAASLDTSSLTLYVANVSGDTVSVLDVAFCNAHVTTGCDQTPLAVRSGNSPAGVLLDPATHTLYVANGGDKTVSLIDTRTCNANRSDGCSVSRPTVPVTAAGRFMAISPATETLYVSIRDDSSLAMIDTTHCNVRDTSGCATSPRIAPVGDLPYGVAVDTGGGSVLVGNVGDSTISAFAGATCNATTTTGCSRTMHTVDTGGWPTSLTVDGVSRTVYVSDNVDATASVVSMRHLLGRPDTPLR